MNRIDARSLAQALSALTVADPRLGVLVTRNGSPPLWPLPAGFATLVRIILEQQVSLDSARRAQERLEAIVEIAPGAVLQLSEAAIRAAGITRQKTAYIRDLAARLLDGRLDLDALGALPTDAAREHLMAVKGIGRWSADVYLMRALGHADVWPPGDIALAAMVQSLHDLPQRPDALETERLAEPWRPFRAVAARVLWHDYLITRGRDLAGMT